jgi:hypothetical protein
MRRACALALRRPSVLSTSAGCSAPLGLSSSQRWLSSYGRITDEDRRWWIIHLECCPDVTPGTFVSWLDSCGTHTTKKLIERNIWTIEQLAALSSDQVDELRYKEGCVHMDVVWEHARTVLTPLASRGRAADGDTALHDRIMELRKKRELERRRGEVLKERADTVAGREATLKELREQIAAKKEALRAKQRARQQADDAPSAEEDVAAAMDRIESREQK